MSSRLALRSYAAVRPVAAASNTSMLRRTIATTRPQWGMKESSSHDPDYEHHKQDGLAKQKQGKGHWKPELASDSEESVKADRAGDHDSSPEALRKLQERTKASAQEKAKHGTSMHDGL